LEGLLRRDGLVLLKVRSGTAALELLLQYDVALAILDVQMPEMDGYELAELMRGTERTRRVPIIFVTAGTADRQRRFRGYETGAVDFLTKPIEPDILRSKASVFFELYQQRHQIAAQRDQLKAYAEALTEEPATVQWFDEQGVETILDVAGSSAALAVNEVAKQRNKILVVNASAVMRLTNEECAPYTVHYVFDTYALAKGTGEATVKAGYDSWFFITANYVFGKELEKNTSAFANENGGKVLGSVRVPLNTADFSSFLLQAQASRAKVVGLANAGADTINAIKQAAEFGVRKSGQRLAALLFYITDVNSLGLETAQGLLLTEAFYWDMNDETRAWSHPYFDKMKKMPNMIQAGVYSSTLHYLKAVKAAGTVEAGAVMKMMKATPINDVFAHDGRIREDGRMVHDMYLFEVKKPSESKEPWDDFKLVATIPAEEAFRPLSQSTCPLVKK
jgi:branched-chain amino acid transport system substrate-binding protein